MAAPLTAQRSIELTDRYWTRRRAAAELTAEFYEIAERTLLGWDDVPIVILNGRAHGKIEDWRRAAKQRLREQLARQGADDLTPLVAARRATAARMARRSDIPPEQVPAVPHVSFAAALPAGRAQPPAALGVRSGAMPDAPRKGKRR
jgi:hypothetical protein